MADPDKEPRFNGKMDGGHAPTGKSRSPTETGSATRSAMGTERVY